MQKEGLWDFLIQVAIRKGSPERRKEERNEKQKKKWNVETVHER